QGTLTVAGQTVTIDQVGPPRPPREEEDLQMGMLLPQGSDTGPKASRPQPNAPSRWLARPLGRAGLALLIACGVLTLLLLINWRQARGRFAMIAAGILSRLQAQIAARLGELFRIGAAAYDKIQVVVGFGRRLFAGPSDKLIFVGHFLAALPPLFKVVSYGGSVMRIGKQKLTGLLPERARAIARRALSSCRSWGVARVLRRALVIALVVRLASPLSPAEADGLVRAAQATWRAASAYTSATANRDGTGSGSGLINRSSEMALG